MITTDCPNHGGAFDCTPFCEICSGEQGVDKMTEQEAIELYEEMLDDGQEWPKVAESHFAPSRILKNLDPSAYRGGLANFIDTLDQIVEGYE